MSTQKPVDVLAVADRWVADAEVRKFCDGSFGAQQAIDENKAARAEIAAMLAELTERRARDAAVERLIAVGKRIRQNIQNFVEAGVVAPDAECKAMYDDLCAALADVCGGADGG